MRPRRSQSHRSSGIPGHAAVDGLVTVRNGARPHSAVVREAAMARVELESIETMDIPVRVTRRGRFGARARRLDAEWTNTARTRNESAPNGQTLRANGTSRRQIGGIGGEVKLSGHGRGLSTPAGRGWHREARD